MTTEDIIGLLQFLPLTVSLTLIVLSYIFGRRSMTPEFILAILLTISATTLFLVYLHYTFYVERSVSTTGMEGIAFFIHGGITLASVALSVVVFCLARWLVPHQRY